MDIELVPLATITIAFRDLVQIGMGPAGDRVIGEISAFEMVGERIDAKLKGVAAADWSVIGPNGIGSVDARLAVETADGAVIYVAYQGRFDVTPGWDKTLIYVVPRFETSDERYAWLNGIQAVGKGVFAEPGVRYDWFELR